MCPPRDNSPRHGATQNDETHAEHANLPIILSDHRHPLWRLNLPAIAVIRLYQVTLSAFLGRSCRFYPTCSNYGLAAHRHHHPLRAAALTISRVARCNPLCKGGYDPVPAADTPRSQPNSTTQH